jgi:ATP-dependent helicase HrpA
MKAHQLPVYRHREKILEALKGHQVIIVESPTGSGKTTQLPVILHEAGYSQLGIIGVTQPRRIATLGVSDFISKQLKSDLGGFVGYKMRFEDKTSPQTRLKIMTDGILLQELKGDPKLSSYSVMMVDEAHERSLNIDFILGLLKQILQQRSDFKVIISSATINVQVFSQYFNNAPIIAIDTPVYPVSVIYDPAESDKEEDLVLKITDRVERIIQTDRKAGDILIFLPGERAIKLCMQALAQCSVAKKLLIIPLYGMLGKQEQERVFMKTPFAKHKVVIATNIAETSITIDGIKTVIDSGLLKANIYNQRTYTNSLVQDLVNKAAADQRKGRAGRTSAGICYRLYSRSAFETRPQFGVEEIFRTDLSEVVLRMAGLGVHDFLGFDFINKPARSGVASGLETLALLGAIDKKHAITNIGIMLLQLPLLPRHGRILVEAIMRYPQVVVESAIACAFLSTNNPFLMPLGEETESRAAQASFQHAKGDFLGYLVLYNAFESATDKAAFCQSNYLDLRTMQEIVNVKTQLEDIAHSLGGVVESGGSTKDYLMCCMAGLVQFICVQTGQNMYQSLTTDRIMIHPGSVLFKKSSPYILAGEIVKTTRMYARSVSAIERDWIAELDPHLLEQLRTFGKSSYQEEPSPVLSKKEKGKAKASKKESKTTSVQPQAITKAQPGVYVGDSSFTLQQGKGKKAYVRLDWQTIWQTMQRQPNAPIKVSLPKGSKATLIYKNDTILRQMSIAFALQYAQVIDPEQGMMSYHSKPIFYNPALPQELATLLDMAKNLGKICKGQSGQVLGFYSLSAESMDKFCFRPQLRVKDFLNNTHEALGLLDDDTLVVKDAEQVQLLNDVIENFAQYLAMI